jgi:hypothetical protein
VNLHALPTCLLGMQRYNFTLLVQMQLVNTLIKLCFQIIHFSAVMQHHTSWEHRNCHARFPFLSFKPQCSTLLAHLFLVTMHKKSFPSHNMKTSQDPNLLFIICSISTIHKIAACLILLSSSAQKATYIFLIIHHTSKT